jgi:hypothetical protein
MNIEGLSDHELHYILLGTAPEAINRPYWAVKVADTGDPAKDWISEAHPKVDLVNATVRNTDWTRDVVHPGHCATIKDLWLFCPSNRLSPSGNTAHIPIHEPNTAFEMKVGSLMSNVATSERHLHAMLVGRVNDRKSGEAVCFIWDEDYGVMWEPWMTNVRPPGMGTWREGIAPLHGLNYNEIGLVL